MQRKWQRRFTCSVVITLSCFAPEATLTAVVVDIDLWVCTWLSRTLCFIGSSVIEILSATLHVVMFETCDVNKVFVTNEIDNIFNFFSLRCLYNKATYFSWCPFCRVYHNFETNKIFEHHIQSAHRCVPASRFLAAHHTHTQLIFLQTRNLRAGPITYSGRSDSTNQNSCA